MLLRIGLIQMNCEKNAIQQNIKQTIDIINKSAKKNIDVLCFPEMSITGYSDPTKYTSMIISLDGPEIKDILDQTKHFSMVILLGLIERNGNNKPFITQIAIQNGEIKAVYRKNTIIDEEVIWFSPGQSITMFNIKNIRSGITICADIGNKVLFSSYAQKGAKLIFESAAPGLYGAQKTRNWKNGFEWWKNECMTNLTNYSKTNNVWIAVATQAGRTIDEDFPGGGFLFNPKGERVFSTDDWRSGEVYLEIDFNTNKVKQI